MTTPTLSQRILSARAANLAADEKRILELVLADTLAPLDPAGVDELARIVEARRIDARALDAAREHAAAGRNDEAMVAVFTATRPSLDPAALLATARQLLASAK